MSLGTLYVSPSPRVNSSKALITYYNLPVKIANLKETPGIEKDFPLMQVPAFMGKNGYKLTEAPAILYYMAGQLPEADRIRLQGSSLEESCEIQRWVSVANTDSFEWSALPSFGIMGLFPVDKDALFHVKLLHQYAAYYNSELAGREYLATDHFTLADLHALMVWTLAFTYLFGVEERAKYPNLIAWFNRAIANPIAATVYPDFKMCDKPSPKLV